MDVTSGDIVEDKVETKADEAKEKRQELKERRANQAKTPASSPR